MKKRIIAWDKKFYSTANLLALLTLAIGVIVFFAFAVANDEAEIGIPALLAGIVLFAGIQLKLILAGHFYSVAVIKGYTDTVYLKLAFWAPIAGYLLVIALPDRNRQLSSNPNPAFVKTSTVVNDLPEL